MLLRQPLAVAPSALIKRTEKRLKSTANVTTKRHRRGRTRDSSNVGDGAGDEQQTGAEGQEAKNPAGVGTPERVGTAELLARTPATIAPAGPAIFNLGNL